MADGSDYPERPLGTRGRRIGYPAQNAGTNMNLLKFSSFPVFIDGLTIKECLHDELVRLGLSEAAATTFARVALPHAAQRRDSGVPLGKVVSETARDLVEACRASAGFDIAASSPAAPPELKKAIYAESDKTRDPITFYREVWKDEAEAGTVTQALVRSVDPSLIKAIRNYCARRSLDPAAVLPPPGKPGRKADRSAEFAIASIEAKREAQRRYEAKGRRRR